MHGLIICHVHAKVGLVHAAIRGKEIVRKGQVCVFDLNPRELHRYGVYGHAYVNYVRERMCARLGDSA